ncbi:methyltransferase [Nautilia sp. PV-1]|uniref:class I SAM-dependent methyltransferase n=1 Tax=Nautilia sp. PV-1 TaxID=2579250 RepID=UPI000FD9B931|nr:class I SAM-dependent methyltransferase [Nautilia sp. PV-1]AZV46046.1 methyltransferase [Nautilia sp. PV-1]
MELWLKKISENYTDTCEFKRLYHGRGENEYKFLTIDSIDEILFVQFYERSDLEKNITDTLKNFIQNTGHHTIIIKKRYNNETFAVLGEIPEEYFAIENGIKFKLNFFNQNIGYFGDMKNSRRFIETIAKDKKILNLFAYTCGFSLFARRGGAEYVANVDMSKSVLATGMANHQINGLDIKNISFWPYNILKAFPKLKRQAPYDIIIIDPPTHQKGSFIASKDYIKIIKKLPGLSHKNTILLACINSPKFSKEELIEMIESNTSFKFQNRIKNPEEYTNSTLKSLVFSIQ